MTYREAIDELKALPLPQRTAALVHDIIYRVDDEPCTYVYTAEDFWQSSCGNLFDGPIEPEVMRGTWKVCPACTRRVEVEE